MPQQNAALMARPGLAGQPRNAATEASPQPLSSSAAVSFGEVDPASLPTRPVRGTQAGYWAPIHDAVQKRFGLTAVQRSVYMALALFTNNGTGLAWPSIAKLAETASCSRRSVSDALRALEAKLLLHTELRGASTRRRVNLYRLLDPLAALRALACAPAPPPPPPEPEPVPAAPAPAPIEPEFEPAPIEPAAVSMLFPEAFEGPGADPHPSKPGGSDENSPVPCRSCTDSPPTLYIGNKTPDGSMKTPNPRRGAGANGEHKAKRFPPKQIRAAAEELAAEWKDAGLEASPRDNQGYRSKRALRAISRALRAGHPLDALKASARRYFRNLKDGPSGLRYARAFANFWASGDYLAWLPKILRDPTPEEIEVRRVLGLAFDYMNPRTSFLADVHILEGEDGERYVDAVEESSRQALRRWLKLSPRAFDAVAAAATDVRLKPGPAQSFL